MYSSCTDCFLIHTYECAQKSWNHTYHGFDPVTPPPKETFFG